jgi:hypothetical protein
MQIQRTKYDASAKGYLARSGHYLDNPPPGALFAVGVFEDAEGLFGVVAGRMVGLCLVGRPVGRMLPQDGTVGEVTRMVLDAGLPHGTASAVLRVAIAVATGRKMVRLIAYHDRTRHTGCIYKKAGFVKDGKTVPHKTGWANRDRPASATAGSTSKRRWSITLTATTTLSMDIVDTATAKPKANAAGLDTAKEEQW